MLKAWSLPSHSARTLSAASLLRSAAATSTPSAIRRRTQAAPIPLPAPVTSTALSFNPLIETPVLSLVVALQPSGAVRSKVACPPGSGIELDAEIAYQRLPDGLIRLPQPGEGLRIALGRQVQP